MTTGRINQVSTSARAPIARHPIPGARHECGWVSASSGRNRELTTQRPKPPRPRFGLDHSSPGGRRRGRPRETRPEPKHRHLRSTDSEENSRASTPAPLGMSLRIRIRLPSQWPAPSKPTTDTVKRQGPEDQPVHDRTRTAPRPRGQRQKNPESRALGPAPHRCSAPAGPRAPSVQPARRGGTKHSPIFPGRAIF